MRQRRQNKNMYRAAAVSIAVACLAACGGDDDPSDPVADTADSSTTVASDAGTATSDESSMESPETTVASTGEPGSSSSDGTGSAGVGYGAFEGLTGEERTNALYEAAKAEGTLTIYATSSEFTSTMQPAFEAAYPGVKIEAYRAASADVRGRVLQEEQAGGVLADLVEGNLVMAAQLVSTAPDLFHPYQNAEISAAITPGYEQLDILTPYKSQTIGTVYNTNLVDASSLPSELEGFGAPEWEGQLGIDLGDVNWFVTLYNYYTSEQGWTDDEFTDMMLGIVGNARIVDGHANNHEFVKSGELPVFVTDFFAYVKPDDPANGPTAVGAVGPVVNSPNGFMLVADAEHPAAALLFQDWALTAGQAVSSGEGNYTPTAPSYAPDYQSPLPDSVPQLVFDINLYNVDPNGWDDAFATILKGERPTYPS